MVFCSLIFLSSALAGLPVDSDKWLPLQVDGVPFGMMLEIPFDWRSGLGRIGGAAGRVQVH